MKKPIAIACSDIHLCDKAPVCRSNEPDWFAAMARPLEALAKLSNELEVPILCAGDLFDKPKASPKLEIFAMHHISSCYSMNWYCIPGQHDLPNHDLNKINESSYGVLSHCDIINTMPTHEDFIVQGFPWGMELQPCTYTEDKPRIAILHKLVWNKKEPYPGAPVDGNVKNIIKKLKGFDIIICGDNHEGFIYLDKNTTVLNCGSLMRRNAAQANYDPMAYIIYDDLSIECVSMAFDCDVIDTSHIDKRDEKNERIDSFVKTLQNDVEIELSFESNLDRYCSANNVEDQIKGRILAHV